MDTKTIIETAEEKLIHTYNRYQIVLDKGDGVRLYDKDGKEYLDFGAGIAVFALGYNNKEYNDAVKAQVDKLIHTSNIIPSVYIISPVCLCVFDDAMLLSYAIFRK